MRKLPAAALLAALGLVTCVAHAGASLLVDDAGTTADGHCQLESWLRARPGALEATAMPACAWAGLEYSAGASAYPAGPGGPALYAGVKHTLVEMGERAPGLAVALGGDWRRRDGGFDAATANLSTSLPLGPRLTLQANLGWRAPHAARGRPTGGVGMEYRPDARWSWLAEAYAEGGGYRAVQGGLRLHLPDAVSVDVLAGRDRDGRWLTLGFNWSPGDDG
ncbi:hypothetical protein QMK61_14330 [Fulvimonas sp. R45]|uniref:hypothetical protein n=1 Tax=Fulvimonas sp. R45 TaxID=3045937 RepID=UPI0026601790|nr:hypothetical protein [Fulvimonas sp. R45]MDO1530014.1 hypothetical protein [Fulvimonas sp. R45]